MPWYFAYGSNMLRARLEARVGPVRAFGVGLLEGHRHSFTKLGRDGTGKGNISRASGERVYGVVYGLSARQLDELARYEGGYVAITVPVVAARVAMRSMAPAAASEGSWADPGADTVEAHTFQAHRPVAAMRPRPDYLDYYMRGMREHGLPEAYRAFIRAQARSTGRSDGRE